MASYERKADRGDRPLYNPILSFCKQGQLASSPSFCWITDASRPILPDPISLCMFQCARFVRLCYRSLYHVIKRPPGHSHIKVAHTHRAANAGGTPSCRSLVRDDDYRPRPSRCRHPPRCIPLPRARRRSWSVTPAPPAISCTDQMVGTHNQNQIHCHSRHDRPHSALFERVSDSNRTARRPPRQGQPSDSPAHCFSSVRFPAQHQPQPIA